MLTLSSKLAKLSKPEDEAKGSGLGVGGTGAARGAAGRGGAGRGGGCFVFLGGSAGLGVCGLSGACRAAKGSHPNGSTP